VAQTRRKIKDYIRSAELVVEILDARIPTTSRSYLLDELLQEKKRIIFLNKSDLASPELTAKWVKHLKNENVIDVIAVSAKDQKTGSVLLKHLARLKHRLKKVRLRHKIVVVGIPNVGKSRMINAIVGSKKTRVANRPGVTRGPQWIVIPGGFEMMDLPGVLAPSVINAAAAARLAICNAIPRDSFDAENMLEIFKQAILEFKGNLLSNKHPFVRLLKEANHHDPWSLFAEVNNMIIKGGEADRERAIHRILKDFDSGKLGRLTMEIPEQFLSESTEKNDEVEQPQKDTIS
jgi:ribosome biogenesis GTPase A